VAACRVRAPRGHSLIHYYFALGCMVVVVVVSVEAKLIFVEPGRR